MKRLTISNYKDILENKKLEIEHLKNTIENFESIQRGICCDCCEDSIQKYSDLYIDTECFRDKYFKGLSYENIADLAKKSIRLTDDNCKMLHKLEDIKEYVDCEDKDNSIVKHIKRILEKEY